jgi:hypothetical protein
MLAKGKKRRALKKEKKPKIDDEQEGRKMDDDADSGSDDFAIQAGDGASKRMYEHKIPINEKLIALGLQSHNFDGGVISAFKADRGGQVLVYQPNI